MKSLKILFLTGFLLISGVKCNTKSTEVTYLEPGKDRVIFEPENRQRFGLPASQVLKIYCFDGRDKNLLNLFNTINFHLDIDDDDFNQYGIASDPAQILEDHHNQKSLFSFNFMSRNKKRMIKFNPYNTSCIGIESATKYKVYLQFIRVDFWRVVMCGAGLIFIISASKLSQNSLFFYLCGVTIGVCASFLVLFYLLHKLIPKKTLMYGTVLTGGSLAIYFGQLIIDNIQSILITYQTFVFWYVVITGVVSFAVCYRYGPPTNQRNKDLIRWSLQAIGFFSIFFSSHFQEATLGIGFLGLAYYYFPRSWLLRVRSFWRRKFPPKPRLLTSEEFIQQGAVETAKALEELKAYCSSPECKQWKLMRSLKDPSRFASFIEGDPHVTNDEMMDYDATMAELNMSDDDSSDDTEEFVYERSSRQGTPVSNNFQQFSRQIASSTPQNQIPQRRTPSRGGTPTVQGVVNRRTPSRRNTPVAVLNGHDRPRSSRVNAEYDLSEDD